MNTWELNSVKPTVRKKNCTVCGKEFFTIGARQRNKKTCSKACVSEINRKLGAGKKYALQDAEEKWYRRVQSQREWMKESKLKRI